jgi:hypothetical protein
MPEVIDGRRGIDGLEPLNEDADQCRAQFRALFPVAAYFSIETFQVNSLARFGHATVQHSRQFFVSHPNLRYGNPARGSHRRPIIEESFLAQTF